MSGKFTKGHKKVGGRTKGTPNKIDADVKNMILCALNNKGGAAYLEEQADANPVAFMALVGKVLPMTVQGDANNPLTFTITTGVPRADDD